MTSFTVSLISGQNRLLPSQNPSEALLLNSFFMHERGGLSLPILYWLKEWQWSSEREKTRRGGDDIKEIKLERNTSGWQTFQSWSFSDYIRFLMLNYVPFCHLTMSNIYTWCTFPPHDECGIPEIKPCTVSVLEFIKFHQRCFQDPTRPKPNRKSLKLMNKPPTDLQYLTSANINLNLLY